MRPHPNYQSGFTYLAVLILVAVMGAVWAALGVVWSTAQQREKERELLFVGDQFRKAIGQYYERSPGGAKKYPTALKDLLKDERQLGTQRYLRKIFIDPMTQSNNWGLVQTAGSGIVGVYSLSEEAPLKTSNFSSADSTFEGSAKYSAWQFIYMQQVQVQNPPTKR
ncbi:MAG: type II secretion system protein [Gallionellaceae bacterium]|nr:type II secretion system protein [Gallionellaceae bacterium]